MFESHLSSFLPALCGRSEPVACVKRGRDSRKRSSTASESGFTLFDTRCVDLLKYFPRFSKWDHGRVVALGHSRGCFSDRVLLQNSPAFNRVVLHFSCDLSPNHSASWLSTNAISLSFYPMAPEKVCTPYQECILRRIYVQTQQTWELVRDVRIYVTRRCSVVGRGLENTLSLNRSTWSFVAPICCYYQFLRAPR